MPAIAFRPASFLEWQRFMERTMPRNLMVTCPSCEGEGRTKCSACGGTGEKECCECGHTRDCPECDGEGGVFECDRCADGKVEFRKLTRAEVKAYLSPSSYHEALMQDAAAFASWFSRPTEAVLVDAGFNPYCVWAPGECNTALRVDVPIHH